MSSATSLPRWVALSAVLAAVLALGSIGYRYRVEQRNRAVTLVAEAESIQELAAAQGLGFEGALASLKARGLGGVVLSEQFVSDLLLVGAVTMVSGKQPGAPFVVILMGPAETLDRVELGVHAGDGQDAAGVLNRAETLNRIERGVHVRFGRHVTARPEPGRLVVNGIAPMTVRSLAIGLNPQVAAAVNAGGLAIVARGSNPPGITGGAVSETLRWMGELGAAYFLPEGDQVLGRRDHLAATGETLTALRMRYCSPEFVKIGGDANVVEADPGNVVRLHSAQVAELDKLPFGEAVDRYARAARERNMRMLLLRPLTFASDRPLDSFGEFVRGVAGAVVRQGGGIGPARPFEDPSVPQPLFLLIALAAAPVVAWVGTLFVADPRARSVGYVLVGLLAAACWMHAARTWMALLAAIAFPVAAYAWFLEGKTRSWLVAYAVMTATSLVGGLCVAGLLNGLPTLVRAEVFEGVKAAHFVPIFLIGWLLFARVADPRKALAGEVRWGQALLTLAGLAVLAVMVARTGNDNPAAVSGFEVKVRNVLDTLLFVRPRTKEFLLGHPLLIVGIALWIRARAADAPPTWKGWAAVALAVGAIGQTSVVNTLCHLHTPIALSMARLGVGWVAGGILGFLLWAVVGRWQRRSGS